MSRDDAGFRPLGEVFPYLRLACLLGAVTGAAAGVWSSYLLQQARAGAVPPSVTNGGLDNPVHSYWAGAIAGVGFAAICLVVLVISYRRTPLFAPTRR